ncbi:MAG: hypothetical protein K5905_30105 [Roseibium sp.]|uniref:hypothetical protein n=1 Tax=Roseibium sp. TaxID=1936156 RepID=UPI002610D64D|nr:hypothetical protein [Roseibium sp.]MCV0429713.1 hypothetical protein [Roseibium sp.]
MRKPDALAQELPDSDWVLGQWMGQILVIGYLFFEKVLPSSTSCKYMLSTDPKQCFPIKAKWNRTFARLTFVLRLKNFDALLSQGAEFSTVPTASAFFTKRVGFRPRAEYGYANNVINPTRRF